MLNVSSDLWQLDVYTCMAGETNTCHRVVPTCHAVGWVAPLIHVADSHGSGWRQSATVTFVLNQSCVCNLARLLTTGYLSESQDSLDIDQRQRTAVLKCFVAARCVHMAGETNARHRVVPTCHAVGWVAPLIRVADSHGSGWSQSATVTFVLNQSCVCNLARLLTIGYLSESQDSLDIDQRQRTAVLNVSSDLWQLDVCTWQARQILVTESCPPVMLWDG